MFHHLNDWLIDRLIYWFDWLSDWVIEWLIDLFNYLQTFSTIANCWSILDANLGNKEWEEEEEEMKKTHSIGYMKISILLSISRSISQSIIFKVHPMINQSINQSISKLLANRFQIIFRRLRRSLKGIQWACQRCNITSKQTGMFICQSKLYP